DERAVGRGDAGREWCVRGRPTAQRGWGSCPVVTRRGWATAILVAWVAALGWLVRREFFQSTGARLAEAALSVPPGAAYYRLDVGGQQVGLASHTIDTLGTTILVP